MQIGQRSLATVREIVMSRLRGLDTDVFLFGSRARGDHHDLSDIDVAILPRGSLPASVIADIREALEESSVPYRVDVVDLREAGQTLRERVLREGIRWTD